MKKLLVLNGSHSDIELILAGKKLGYYVITTGNRPDLIGHKYADEYVYGDFSNPEEIYNLFKDREIDGVCSCANDFGAITAAYLSDRLGLPGHDSYDTTLILHHKDKFKEFSKKYNIHTPRADYYSSKENALSNIINYDFPLMIKPIDLTGGKGVSKVINEAEYIVALNKAFDMSPLHRIVIEPFIEGTQHSFSTFLINKKVKAYFSDNEYSYKNPYLVSTSAGPATDVDKVKQVLIDEAEKIAAILNLRDGIFHYQYLLYNNEPYIIEITRRCSGDMYSTPVKHALKLDWAEWIVRSECGMSCENFPIPSKQIVYGGRHCIMGEKNGIVKSVFISDEIKDNIYDEFLWWKKGTEIKNYLVDKLGIIFLEYKDYDEMIYKSEHISELIKVIYEE